MLPFYTLSFLFAWLLLGSRPSFAENATTSNKNPDETLAQEVATAMVNSVDCGSCFDLLEPLQKLAKTGDKPFSDMLVEACVLVGQENFVLCNGTLSLTAPQIAHDLRSITVTHDATKDGVVSQARQLLCATLFGACSFPPPPAVNLPLPPPPKNPKKFESKGGKLLKWVHISDVHIDRSYLPGSDTNCSFNLCCRDFDPSSVGPNVLHPAQPFGDSKCDSPVTLAMSMIQAIQSIPDINGTFFTGDIPEGLDYQYTQKEITDNLVAWYSESQSLNPYQSLGNHDSSPVNTMTFSPRHDSDWIYNITALWAKTIGEQAADFSVHHAGTYAAVHPGTNLKIIAMNTILYYQVNFINFDQDFPPFDPSGQLQFLIQELQKSEDAGQRVWIIGHIPSGKTDTLVAQSRYMDEIFKRYENTIAAKFYGHSHKDQFEIGYSDYSNQTIENAIGISFVSGAMTPTSGNPVFRVYFVDPDTYEVMDFEPMITNLTAPGFQQKPQWTTYYSARELYGDQVQPPLLPNEPLDSKFFHKLTEAFERNETLFQIYNTGLSRGGAVVACTGACKTKVICEQRAARTENNCDPKTAVNASAINPRDFIASVVSPPDPHECGGHGIHSIARKIIGPISEEKLDNALRKRDITNIWHNAFIDAAMKGLGK